MRSVINISLPTSMAQIVDNAISDGHYASKSEFFRNLLRNWMETQLANELKQSHQELASGQGKLLKSLKDLR